MVKAYVLVTTYRDSVMSVRSDIEKIMNISDAEVVSGKFDIICIVTGQESSVIVKTVLEIRKIRGVISTTTALVL